ncbi:MAG: hypothetical protein COB84_03545 [Rhodobacteraceae bacterium]|nr:MAG: hypothetical protein COB84_03545 [Paracoccaceae bacterium]
MPLPILPMILIAGTVALARNIQISSVDQRVEDRLDDVAEGFSVHRDPQGRQVNAAYRWKRVVRFGATGQRFEVDVSALSRIRFRKV